MQPVNIVLGRFQPFTNGHLRCVEEAYKQTGLDTILCVIETKPEKCDSRHPFPSTMIIPIIQEQIKAGGHIKGVCLVTNADIVKIAEKLSANGFSLACWSCGTDRYDGYSRQCKNYWEKAGLPKEPQCLEVKRGDDDVSATKVRQCLMDNDQAGFKDLMPKAWWGSFKELQKQIKKINEHRTMKPLYDYLVEATQTCEVRFSLQAMIEYGAWIPNDDLSSKDYKELEYAIQDRFKPRRGLFEINGCTAKMEKVDKNYYMFTITCRKGDQGAVLDGAIKEICKVFTEHVYSVVGSDDDISELKYHHLSGDL